LAGYALSPELLLQWIPHGDHNFQPSRSSGLTGAGHWALAVEHPKRFCRDRLGG
jgi:predicted alpha/beta-hydrolase family hydrolase